MCQLMVAVTMWWPQLPLIQFIQTLNASVACRFYINIIHCSHTDLIMMVFFSILRNCYWTFNSNNLLELKIHVFMDIIKLWRNEHCWYKYFIFISFPNKQIWNLFLLLREVSVQMCITSWLCSLNLTVNTKVGFKICWVLLSWQIKHAWTWYAQYVYCTLSAWTIL